MLEVPAWVIGKMHEKVVLEYPKEATGAVLYRKGGPGEHIDHEYRIVGMRNSHPDPRRNYAWDPKQQRVLWETMDRTGMQLYAIYHSHPETDPSPSTTDQQAAWFLGVHYVIFSLAVGVQDHWFESYLCTRPGHLEPEEVNLR